MEHMLDKDVERVLFSEEELHRRVAEIAAEIDRDYAGREPLLVSVLRGSFVFMADLVRQIHAKVKAVLENFHLSNIILDYFLTNVNTK